MAFAGAAGAQDLTLRMPAEMVAKGLDKQLLPRFKFKHRVSVEAVTDGNADMVLGPGAAGTRVFEDAEGNAWRLEILAG
ncbi:MAG: hypothetical protein HKO04_14005, partial [Silicimonas sp.]|nr:hypothetical protein [Silicimonas sp.]